MGCQVILPPGLPRRIDDHLENYLSSKPSIAMFSRSSSNCSIATDEGLFELPEPLPHSTAAMENIIWRRSMQMHTEQRSWQVYLFISSNIDLKNFGVHMLWLFLFL